MSAAGQGASARTWLALGAAAGLALAAASLLRAPERDRPPADSVALVNGVPIRTDAFRRLVTALDADRRAPLDAADHRHVLDRMIDEELLVQHAVDLGLVRTDRRVRADLVGAALAAINAAADAYEPDPEEVEAFYAENHGYFALPARLHVRQVFVATGDGDDDARERAERAAERLRAGDDPAAVRRELGDEVLAPVPDAPLPRSKLREYLGPSLVDAVAQLEPGAVTGPLPAGGGLHVLVLVDRVEAEAPPLEEVESQVRAEMRRREGDRLLRERLDELRADGDVRVVDVLPGSPAP